MTGISAFIKEAPVSLSYLPYEDTLKNTIYEPRSQRSPDT